MGFWENIWYGRDTEKTPVHWSETRRGRGIGRGGEVVVAADAPRLDKLNNLAQTGFIGGTTPSGGFETFYDKGVVYDKAALQKAYNEAALQRVSDAKGYHTEFAPEYSEKMSPAAIAAAKGYHTQPAPEYGGKMSPAAIASADTPVDGLEGLYTIRQGDTLGDLTGGDYELARKIAEYNNLEDWNKINSGQTLRMKGEWLTPSNRLLNNTLANIRYPG